MNRHAATASLLGLIGLLAGLLVAVQPVVTSTPSTNHTPDSLVRRLASPAGKVKNFGFINPGGAWLSYSPSMDLLVEKGNAIQARLLVELNDPEVQNEVALVLGDQQAVPRLIELLPTTETLTEDEAFSATCVLRALSSLTGKRFGVHTKWYQPYTPAVRLNWQAWYSANKDYLYTPSDATGNRVLVDGEAKFAARPVAAYRAEHPRVAYGEIEAWSDGAEYERNLKAFCYTLLVDAVSDNREAMRALSYLDEPRALAVLHSLCAAAKDISAASDLIWILGEKRHPSSIPVLERIPRSGTPEDERRDYAVARVRHFERHRTEVQNQSLDPDDQFLYARCLDGPAGVEELIAELRNPDHDCFLWSHTNVAGRLDREPVRAALRQLANDPTRTAPARTMAHAALARLGDKDSLSHLKRSLTDAHPGVRLAAAEGLWRLESREGFPTLVALLALRPLETGGEGVSSGNGAFLKVEAIRGGNVEHVRSACRILGEMGDRSAIPALRQLLSQNLNGVLTGGGSGTGWGGRPDAVALAKLGDDSGVELLRESIRHDDRLDVINWYRGSDYGSIGQKRFVPDLLPLLNSKREEKRILAAREILLLLERGR